MGLVGRWRCKRKAEAILTKVPVSNNSGIERENYFGCRRSSKATASPSTPLGMTAAFDVAIESWALGRPTIGQDRRQMAELDGSDIFCGHPLADPNALVKYCEIRTDSELPNLTPDAVAKARMVRVVRSDGGFR